jgi:hypothetical protein
MSAWIVSRAHIDVLVQALAESERVTDVDPDELGRQLWRENVKAVSIRYPGDTGDGDRPGPIGFRDADADAYTYRRPSKRIELPGVHKAIAAYQYQCAEYDGWDEAQAQLWLNPLRQELEARGIRYNDDDPWGYDEDDVHVSVEDGVIR